MNKDKGKTEDKERGKLYKHEQQGRTSQRDIQRECVRTKDINLGN